MPLTLLAAVLLAQAPSPPPGTVQIEEGAQKVFTIPGLQRVAVSNVACWDVKTIGNSQVLVIGGPAGCKVTMLVWKSNGERVSWLLEMVKPKPPRGLQPVKVAPREEPAVVVSEEGAKKTTVTVLEISGEVEELNEGTHDDGGAYYWGYDARGARVELELTPYVPKRRPRGDGGTTDGGQAARPSRR